jgi:vacuolar protein sorting-associated protein IST1
MLLSTFPRLRELDPGISEAVCALIYAAPRVDVTELTAIREQLINKFGRELLDRINNNALECVNPRVLLFFRMDQSHFRHFF